MFVNVCLTREDKRVFKREIKEPTKKSITQSTAE